MIGFAGYSFESNKKKTESHFPGDESSTKKVGDQANLSFTKVSIYIVGMEQDRFSYIFNCLYSENII